MPSDYASEGHALVKRRQVDMEHTVVFSAEGIRQERTGVHARISVDCNGAVLAWSNFNVEKDEDRVRLSNSAYLHLNGMSAVYPKTHLKNDLDQFCAGLWDAQLGQLAPVQMNGTLKPTPPSFILYPFLLSEGGTIIFAPPGRGKSYTLMLMAVCVDAGLETLWEPVKRSKVLFINLERGSKSVADRLGNINGALGLDRYRPLATINARGKSLADVSAAAERYVGENDVGAVFVDSISRAGVGNLNDNQDVNRVCDMMNRLGPAWAGLAHTPRADESHLYGGIHFEAAADVVVQLLSEQDEEGPLGIGLQITKQNDIGRVPLWTVALEFSVNGLDRVRQARRGEFPEIEAGKKMSLRESVRQHLIDVGASSATQIADALGLNRSNVANVLATHKTAFEVAERRGSSVLYTVTRNVAV